MKGYFYGIFFGLGLCILGFVLNNQKHDIHDEGYNIGYRCAEIVDRMNDLEDTGPGYHEYGSLSNEFFDIGCVVEGQGEPEPVSNRVDKYGRPIKYANCAYMDDDCYWYADQGIESCEQFTGDEKEMCYGDLNFWRENRENR